MCSNLQKLGDKTTSVSRVTTILCGKSHRREMGVRPVTKLWNGSAKTRAADPLHNQGAPWLRPPRTPHWAFTPVQNLVFKNVFSVSFSQFCSHRPQRYVSKQKGVLDSPFFLQCPIFTMDAFLVTLNSPKFSATEVFSEVKIMLQHVRGREKDNYEVKNNRRLFTHWFGETGNKEH